MIGDDDQSMIKLIHSIKIQDINEYKDVFYTSDAIEKIMEIRNCSSEEAVELGLMYQKFGLYIPIQLENQLFSAKKDNIFQLEIHRNVGYEFPFSLEKLPFEMMNDLMRHVKTNTESKSLIFSEEGLQTLMHCYRLSLDLPNKDKIRSNEDVLNEDYSFRKTISTSISSKSGVMENILAKAEEISIEGVHLASWLVKINLITPAQRNIGFIVKFGNLLLSKNILCSDKQTFSEESMYILCALKKKREGSASSTSSSISVKNMVNRFENLTQTNTRGSSFSKNDEVKVRSGSNEIKKIKDSLHLIEVVAAPTIPIKKKELINANPKHKSGAFKLNIETVKETAEGFLAADTVLPFDSPKVFFRRASNVTSTDTLESARLGLISQETFSGYVYLKMKKITLADVWERKWVVLSGNFLVFFDDENEKDIVKVVDLLEFDGDRLIPPVRYGSFQEHNKYFVIAISILKKKKIFIQLSDMHDIDEWMSVLLNQFNHCLDAKFSCRWEINTELHSKLIESEVFKSSIDLWLPQSFRDETVNMFDDDLIKSELKENGYAIHEKPLLGEGNFGRVLLATQVSTGIVMAIKCCKFPPVTDEKRCKIFRYEVECLERLQIVSKKTINASTHNNIVKFYGMFESKNYLYLCLEWIQGRELMDIITKDGPLSEKKARLYFKCITDAIRYMHKRRVCHRDLKTENVMITPGNSSSVLKLLDFGFAKCLSIPNVHQIGNYGNFLVKVRSNSPSTSPSNSSGNGSHSSNNRMLPSEEDYKNKTILHGEMKDCIEEATTPVTSPDRNVKAGVRGKSVFYVPKKKNSIALMLADSVNFRNKSTSTVEGFLGSPMNNSALSKMDSMYDELDERNLMKTHLGTRYAAAPEVLAHKSYTCKVDSWGLGIILYMMLIGKPPFSDLGGPAEEIRWISIGAYKKPEPQWSKLSQEVKDLIKALLSIDPLQRPDPVEILEYPWVLDIIENKK